MQIENEFDVAAPPDRVYLLGPKTESEPGPATRDITLRAVDTRGTIAFHVDRARECTVTSTPRFQKVHVEGNVEIFSGAMHVKAETMDYDLQKHIMIARGAGRRRVIKFNERNQEEASFDEFIYDTVKGTVIGSKNGVFTQDK